jgi:hypothetical protein
VFPDKSTGHFKTTVPEGKYRMISNVGEQTQTFLPGGSYHIEYRMGFLLNYQVSKKVSATGEVTIKLTVQGSGSHQFNIRTDNLTMTATSKTVKLTPGSSLSFELSGHITSPDEPWVAVIVPDNNLSQRKETRGAVWEK